MGLLFIIIIIHIQSVKVVMYLMCNTVCVCVSIIKSDSLHMLRSMKYFLKLQVRLLLMFISWTKFLITSANIIILQWKHFVINVKYLFLKCDNMVYYFFLILLFCLIKHIKSSFNNVLSETIRFNFPSIKVL